MFAIAEKLNLSVTQLDDVDLYWINAARAMLEAERIVKDRRDATNA